MTRASPTATGRAKIEGALRRATGARSTVLAGFSSARIIQAIARTADDWCRDRGDVLSTTARDLAPRIGLAADMIRHGLGLTFEALRSAELERLVCEQTDDPALLEPDAAPDERLGGPPAVLHMLAGNVPGLAVHPVAVSMIARSVAVVRDSARQPLVTSRLAESLARHEPELAAMIVPVGWRSDSAAPPQEIADLARRIEIYGADATVTRIARQFMGSDGDRDREVVERATRVSVAIVAPDVEPDTAATAVAHDAVLYDGLGCLSPGVVIVEGDAVRVDAVIASLARALDALERRWPRQPRDPATEAARRAFIEEAEAAEIAGRGRLIVGESETWALAAAGRLDDGLHDERTLAITPGVGMRCLRLIALPSRAATLERLRASATPLAAVGLASAGSVDSAACHGAGVPRDVAAALAATGAAIVCPVGRMQAPSIDRDPDGGRRLADLLRPLHVSAHARREPHHEEEP